MNQLKLNKEKSKSLNKGIVIPSLPLALNKSRQLDERRQWALIRYYLDAGAGGLAVAVHTTQFEIRLPQTGLFRPILELVKEEHDRFVAKNNKHNLYHETSHGKNFGTLQDDYHGEFHLAIKKQSYRVYEITKR